MSNLLREDTRACSLELDEDDVTLKTSNQENTDQSGTPALIKWKFGEGREGVFVQPTSKSRQVLVVGRGIPWWGMVVACLDLRIHSILLNDQRFVSVVSKYFGMSIPIGKSVNQTQVDILMTRNALKSCPVLALETLPNSGAVLSEMWVMGSVKLILVSHGRLIGPSPGWSLSRKAIHHDKVDGVTDVSTFIGIYFRCNQSEVVKGLGASKSSAYLKRDIRSILKMAIRGRRCGSPRATPRSDHHVGGAVKTVRPGVIMNSGLLAVTTLAGSIRLPKVKTLFGGDMWVIQSLTPSEVIACWDVPEKLVRLFETDGDRISLMKEMFVPLKIRHSAL